MANENIADFERNRYQRDFTRLYGLKGGSPGQPMRSWCDLERTVRRRNFNQPEADDHHVWRECEIRQFGEERALIIDMQLLILRSGERNVAAPLVGDDAVVHSGAHDREDSGVEEEFRRKAGRVERHGKKVPVRPAIRFAEMAAEVIEKHRPESVTASLDQRRREMRFKHTESVFVQLCELPAYIQARRSSA